MNTKIKFGLLLAVIVVVFGIRPESPELSHETLLQLVNQDRAVLGLKPLRLNPTLSLAALAKASDMVERNYFAHISPDGVKPWHWFKSLGYNYAYAGENLAVNFSDSLPVHEAWMASEGHRKNILNKTTLETIKED